MATPTYTPLANITLGSSAASVTFSSISQAYRDLVLVVSATHSSTSTSIYGAINDDNAGTTYSSVKMLGNGSTASSGTTVDFPLLLLATSGMLRTASGNSVVVQFMDYSATDKHKSVLSRANHPDFATEASVNRWANTAAITKIYLRPGDATNFAAGSTFALYGIAS